jgi:hypothetical protein
MAAASRANDIDMTTPMLTHGGSVPTRSRDRQEADRPVKSRIVI